MGTFEWSCGGDGNLIGERYGNIRNVPLQFGPVRLHYCICWHRQAAGGIVVAATARASLLRRRA